MESKRAIVYTKPGCPQCVQAKQLLESKNYEVDELRINEDVTLDDMFTSIGKVVKTVPQIFIITDTEAEYLGDYLALVKHFS